MHISFSTTDSGLLRSVGYGQAAMGVVNSLQSLGHLVTPNNPKAQIQLNFIQPTYYVFNRPDQYSIGYTPWESTKLPVGWKETFDRCDEVWTTSELIAQWYEDEGVKKPVRVYEHGIHDVWKNVKVRTVGSKFRFLHIGEPAPRKGGTMAVEAFIELFGNNEDYQLTVKVHESHSLRPTDKSGRPINLNNYKNISLISREMEEEELVQLMHMNHVLLYPSWGEGFGFIPLQAMATAMPVISVAEWAPYKNFIPLQIESELTDSPWPIMHPGKMFKPSKESLKELMLESVNNYRKYSAVSLKNTSKIYQKYDWIKLTEQAFSHL